MNPVDRLDDEHLKILQTLTDETMGEDKFFEISKHNFFGLGLFWRGYTERIANDAGFIKNLEINIAFPIFLLSFLFRWESKA